MWPHRGTPLLYVVPTIPVYLYTHPAVVVVVVVHVYVHVVPTATCYLRGRRAHLLIDAWFVFFLSGLFLDF